MTRRPRRTAFGQKLAAAMTCKASGGKRCYVSEEAAMKVIEASHRDPRWKNIHGQPARRAYLCPDCGWWHLTSKKGDDES